MRKITKLRRSVRAISPVISVLLMIAIAVVASLVAYAWVMGMIGTNTEKAGKAIQIQSIHIDQPSRTVDYVYVQNVGQGDVTFDPAGSVYINDVLQPLGTGDFIPNPLKPGQTTQIHTSYTLLDDSAPKVKVVTKDGTFTQTTGKLPSGSGGGGSTTQYTVSFAAGPVSGGTTTPSTPQTVNAGASIPITANPAAGYNFASWSTSGSITVADVNSASTSAIINGDGTITAHFETIQLATPTVSAPTLTPQSPITLGASVTASVTVSGSAGTPTGTVTFQYSIDSGTTWNTLGTSKTLSSGSATSDSYTPTATGSNYAFRAQYSGDSNYNPSTGTTTPLTVNAVQQPVTYVSAGSGVANTGSWLSSTTLNAPYPSGLQANDLLILQVTIRYTSGTPTTPSGWTLLSGPDTTSSTARQWIYYKFTTGSESSTQSITFPSDLSGVTLMARMYAFRGVATSSFTESSSFGSGNSNTISARTVTTTGTGRLAVSFVFVSDNNAVGPFTGMSGGTWTEPVNEYTTTEGSNGCIQLQTATMASAGTISGGSYTMSGSDAWGVRAFALIPK